MQNTVLSFLGIYLCLFLLAARPKPKRKKKNALSRHYRLHRAFGYLAASREKQRLLEAHGWYPNICGGWAHPHAMDYMGPWEIFRCGVPELEYKLKHGSQAPLPPKLQKRKE